jgi:cell wall assembly regulator SMI1
MTTWDQILQLLSQHDVTHGKGATDEDISAAEAVLGVRFTEELRQYLGRIGWIDHDMGFYGLGKDVPSKALDLIANTRCEREEAGPPMQHHLIPILNNGGGDHWCVDTRSGVVVEWRHDDDEGEDQTPEVIDASFASWLHARLRESLEDEAS